MYNTRSIEKLEETMKEADEFFQREDVQALAYEAFEILSELESYRMGKTCWDRTYTTKHPSKAMRDRASLKINDLWDFGHSGLKPSRGEK